MKNIYKGDKVDNIVGTPYRVGETVTLLKNVSIGNKLYEKGDFLSIAEIKNSTEYTEDNVQIDTLPKYSSIFNFTLTDGTDISYEVDMSSFLVGKHDQIDIDCYDSIISSDKQKSNKASIINSIGSVVSLMLPFFIIIMLSISDTVRIYVKEYGSDFLLLLPLAIFCVSVICASLFQLYNNTIGYSISNKYPYDTEAKRAIEMSFSKMM